MKEKHLREAEYGGTSSQHPSPLELIRMRSGRSHRVGESQRAAPDSMLAVYRDRVTYTFIMEEEVASIHFDRQRGEIFFRGHNIAHMELTPRQREALLAMEGVLEADEQARPFFEAYGATLHRLLADK